MSDDVKLTPDRHAVLLVVRDNEGADAWRVACLCNARSPSHWAHGKLRALERGGYIEAVGRNWGGSRRWRITEAGRTALEKTQ